MNLFRALRLDLIPLDRIRTAWVGAGGKTTAMFQLARELPPPVLLTTTTHLGTWQLAQADHHITLAGAPLNANLLQANQGITLLTGKAEEDQRVKGLNPADLTTLVEMADRLHRPIILEADGSRRLPLKAPAEHEPAIPDWARQVVVVAGLSALGHIIQPDTVHRAERFAQIAGQPLGSEITEETIIRVLLHPQGGMAKIRAGIRRSVLLNQADQPEQVQAGLRIARALVKGDGLPGFDSALVASLANHGTVHFAVEPIAGIVLAAGGATRFGSPKILLQWQGKPLIRHVVETALAGGLHPVTVVLGAVTDPAVQALEGLPIQIVFNPAWAEGQSTSLKAGVQPIMDQGVGGAVFLLADQPFINTDIIQALCLEHARNLASAIVPQVGERRTNPVLFDRVTFTDMLSIQGDIGGRALFAKYPPQFLPWEDERLLLDLDTQQDYENLLHKRYTRRENG